MESLAAQTVPVDDVLVVDAGSRDRTVALARAWGARVLLGGGLPGVSRNYGAEWARGEWLLFLDADVVLPPDAVETAFREVRRRGLDAASCAFAPDRGGALTRLHHRLSWEYFHLASRVGWCHSIGAFLLVRRSLHDAVGGFDPGVLVAEDQDYVLRLNRAGRYGYLRRPMVRIAVRRFEQQGFVRMSLKWLGIELYRLVLGEIRSNRFRYFG
ncbi:MAG: glycosyltransferase [Longimicrobiales bacterium]|nr:glycosyltransferase [Longimicrobiales bacterium]